MPAAYGVSRLRLQGTILAQLRPTWQSQFFDSGLVFRFVPSFLILDMMYLGLVLHFSCLPMSLYLVDDTLFRRLQQY